MQQVFIYLFSKTSYHARAIKLKNKLNFNPLDYSWLSYKNLRLWLVTTSNWISLLETPYIQKRIRAEQEANIHFGPNMVDYVRVMHKDLETTTALVKKLDAISLNAINMYYPDKYFQFVRVSDLGPITKIMEYIIEQKKSIPHKIFNLYVMSLPLYFSLPYKSLQERETINDQDLKFIALFLTFIASNPEYFALIEESISDINIQALVVYPFSTIEKRPSLYWNESIVEKCFKAAVSYRKNYQKAPKDTLKDLYGKDDVSDLFELITYHNS